jgi:hypothetical protein
MANDHPQGMFMKLVNDGEGIYLLLIYQQNLNSRTFLQGMFLLVDIFTYCMIGWPRMMMTRGQVLLNNY